VQEGPASEIRILGFCCGSIPQASLAKQAV